MAAVFRAGADVFFLDVGAFFFADADFFADATRFEEAPFFAVPFTRIVWPDTSRDPLMPFSDLRRATEMP